MRKNPPLLVTHAALYFALFPIPVITLFWKDHIGMSLADIMVLQAVFGVAVILFEFPSGYLADRVGHRLSLAVGASLWLGGCLAYLPASSFAAVAAAEIALGAGRAFISGADRALLWASLDTSGRRGQYRRWDGRLRAAGQASEAVSAAAGGWLYSIAPRLPFWFQVPTAALALASVLALRPPPASRTAPAASHGRRILDIVRLTLWRHRRLQAAMALSVALGLSSYVMVWLIQPYLQSRGVPTAWFGPFWAGANAWLVAVSLASARIVERLGVRATLLGCCLLVPLGYAGLAASAAPWGAAFYLCFMTVRGLQGPILVTAMQEDAPDSDRASVLSLAALLFRLAFAGFGPPIGALVDRAGMDAAFAVLAGVFAIMGLTALALFSRAHGHPPRAGTTRL
jgi:predicted MFS family arabinose efflux permease